ncbi:hypothetical protein [Hippocampus erectus paramyxovirus 1]|nr:hypothetical protein [Hippocampus erectus paramyxovirus 1]
MSDDLGAYAETKEDLENSIGFIEAIISESGEIVPVGKKQPSESIRKIPKGIVSKRKGIYGGHNTESRRRPPRRSVRFGGMGKDTDEEADGEEDDDGEDNRPAESKGRRGSDTEGSGIESTAESEGAGVSKEDIETEPKKTSLFIMEAKARREDLGAVPKRKSPKFLPPAAFPPSKDKEEPLYVEPNDYRVTYPPKPRRLLDPAGAVPRSSRRPNQTRGLEENAAALKSMAEARVVDPTSSMSKGKVLEKVNIGPNNWPGYGPFEELLRDVDKFDILVSTESFAPYITATRIDNANAIQPQVERTKESVHTTLATTLFNMKMLMDERGNRDLLLLVLSSLSSIQEALDSLVRQVQNLTLEQSVLKSTLSDLYIILDRGTGDVTDDSLEETAVAMTRRSKTGRVTLDKVVGDEETTKERVMSLIKKKTKKAELKAPRLDPSKSNATVFKPREDEVSAAVLSEIAETDAVSAANKHLVRTMISMAKDTKTLGVIHSSIVSGRYK